MSMQLRAFIGSRVKLGDDFPAVRGVRRHRGSFRPSQGSPRYKIFEDTPQDDKFFPVCNLDA
jgi:hypothetical protein